MDMPVFTSSRVEEFYNHVHGKGGLFAGRGGGGGTSTTKIPRSTYGGSAFFKRVPVKSVGGKAVSQGGHPAAAERAKAFAARQRKNPNPEQAAKNMATEHRMHNELYGKTPGQVAHEKKLAGGTLSRLEKQQAEAHVTVTKMNAKHTTNSRAVNRETNHKIGQMTGTGVKAAAVKVGRDGGVSVRGVPTNFQVIKLASGHWSVKGKGGEMAQYLNSPNTYKTQAHAKMFIAKQVNGGNAML